MAKLQTSIREFISNYASKKILHMNLFDNGRFQQSLRLTLGKDAPLASTYMKQELQSNIQQKISINQNAIEIDQDLDFAEEEFITVEKKKLRPGQVFYDEATKKILLLRQPLQSQENSNQDEEAVKVIPIGRFNTSDLDSKINQQELDVQTLLLNDLYTQRFIHFLFVFSGTIFLSKLIYTPEFSVQEFIGNEEQYYKITH